MITVTCEDRECSLQRLGKKKSGNAIPLESLFKYIKDQNDTDVDNGLTDIDSVNWMEAYEKRTLAKMKKSQMKSCLTLTPSDMGIKKICYSPIRQNQDSPTHPGGSTQVEETTKDSKTTDTENGEVETEEVYPLRALIFLFILVSISFIILIIIGIISLTWQKGLNKWGTKTVS